MASSEILPKRSLDALRTLLLPGMVIPAHPLALTEERRLDERHQRALSRYYLASGAGGLAVGVHTTQFAIHDPKVGLYPPVLELAVEEAQRHTEDTGDRPVLVAGVVGATEQAVKEAALARDLGYDCVLLSLKAMAGAGREALIAHVYAVAEVLPVFGFYLQPTLGGPVLDYAFWRDFAAIPNVVGVKIAPFNRYQTLDVVRGLADSGRGGEIALYTGNDDTIVMDLLTRFPYDGLRITGGLLGHWAVWTSKAVALLAEIHALTRETQPVPAEMLTRAAQITDANAALFDPAHGFAGCIPGIHEVLRRQGLLSGRWCLEPEEELSPGQMAEIDRVIAAYPDLQDDVFVQAHLDAWLQ